LSVAVTGILSQVLLPRKPKGVIAGFEMLVITPAIANLIRENKVFRIDSSIQTGKKHGMILLDDSLFDLWRRGLVDEEEAILKARKANELRQRIARAKKGLLDEEEPSGDGEPAEEQPEE
jgi:twitching motility protein PilT